MNKTYKRTLSISLLVAFIDFFGVGLVYPLFSSMLFDSGSSILSLETTSVARGVWLGVLIALMPLFEFLSAPIWGALSDSKGRKKPLQLSLAIIFFGYLIAVFGVWINHLFLLLLSRIIIGIGAGNTSIVQAAIADISHAEEKTKNFGLYTTALGIGFALGPFMGGILSIYGYSIPFLFAALITLLNLVFALRFFEETNRQIVLRRLKWGMAFTQFKQIVNFEGIRMILISSFLYNFGWSYFFEFAPVYLIKRFSFSSAELGIFYGTSGGLYALCAGLLIRPFINRIRPERLFVAGIFFASSSILLMPLMPSTFALWPLIFVMCFFVSFVAPTSTSLVSNSASPQAQGEALGILSSVNAAAFVLSPMFSGSFVGAFPSLPMWFGGTIMMVASIFALFSTRLKQRPAL